MSPLLLTARCRALPSDSATTTASKPPGRNKPPLFGDLSGSLLVPLDLIKLIEMIKAKPSKVKSFALLLMDDSSFVFVIFTTIVLVIVTSYILIISFQETVIPSFYHRDT